MIPAHPIPEGRRRRSRAGNAMIELALGATVLGTVFASAFEYGYIFYQYNFLYNAVNNGGRYASMYPYDASSPDYTTNPTSHFGPAVQDMVAYGDPSGASTSPVLKNLGTSNVTISVTGTGDSTATPSTWVPSTIKVSISNYTISGIFGSYTFNGKPSVTYPFVGNYIPPP